MNRKISIVMAVLVMISVIGIGVVSASNVPSKVVVKPTIVGGSVNANLIDFGELYAGGSSTASVNVQNTGTGNEKVSVSSSVLTGTGGATIPATQLSVPPLAGTLGSGTPLVAISSFSAGATQAIGFQLDVPVAQQPDTYQGTIDFIFEAA